MTEYDQHLNNIADAMEVATRLIQSDTSAQQGAEFALAVAQISATLAMSEAIREQTAYMKANDARVFGEPVETTTFTTTTKECVCE